MRDIVLIKATFTVVMRDRRWQTDSTKTFEEKIPYVAYEAYRTGHFLAKARIRRLAKWVIESKFRKEFLFYNFKSFEVKVSQEELDGAILIRDLDSDQLEFKECEQLSLRQEYTGEKELERALEWLWKKAS